jgi:hypothetical protein
VASLHDVENSGGGFAHRFRPMYAGANMGHPSDFRWVLIEMKGDRGRVAKREEGASLSERLWDGL